MSAADDGWGLFLGVGTIVGLLLLGLVVIRPELLDLLLWLIP